MTISYKKYKLFSVEICIYWKKEQCDKVLRNGDAYEITDYFSGRI